MSTNNEPIPVNFYSRTEMDLKLENMEQRLFFLMDRRFDQVMAEFRSLRMEIMGQMNLNKLELKHDLNMVNKR